MAAKASSLKPVRKLTKEEYDTYWRQGYLNVKAMFSPEEMAVLKAAIEGDALLDAKRMDMKDATGRVSKLTLWNYVLPNTYGAFAAGARMAAAARKLLGVEPYHFHTKIMLKEPRSGGAWNVHQDFGYWYRTGTMHPDQMMSCILAVDQATLTNGCLEVLEGSHKLGRLEHGTAGADPRMIEQARKRLKHVVCTMEPGDMLFTHSNLVHWSGQNNSDSWRRALIVAYNGVDNPPYPDNGICPQPVPLTVYPDDAILKWGPVGHDAKLADTASFLDTERNVKAFAKGTKYEAADATSGLLKQ